MDESVHYPRLTCRTDILRANARFLTGEAAKRGVEIAGVVKCCCGAPEAARAFMEGGCAQIADSRIQNLKKLRYGGTGIPLWLLRLPMPSEAEEIVRFADLSLNSSPRMLELLSRAAVRAGKIHQVLLMVDLGDRREGVQPGDLDDLFRYAGSLPGIYPAGIGTNLTCYGGIVPDSENMGLLSELAEKIERDHARKLRYVSAGNSSALKMLFEGTLPPRLNHLRCGESLLLGRETCDGSDVSGMRRDAFTLTAEIIEAAVKPSRPSGISKMNAFGEKPDIPDLGNRTRLILGIGREDVDCGGLTPCRAGLRILGASSDHLIVDSEECPERFSVGETLDFIPDYGALLNAMTSPYIEKVWRSGTLPRTSFSGWKTLPASSFGTMGDIENAVRSSLAQGLRPLVKGGSHRTALPFAGGLDGRIRACGWLMFSAFSDFNTAVTGSSPDGMTLASLCAREGAPHPPKIPLREEQTVLIGLRSVDPQERMMLRSSGILVFTMEEIDRRGMADVMADALDSLSGMELLAADFSLSVLDPSFTGAVNVPPCGITLREAFCALEMISDTGKLAGALLTEIPPGESAARCADALTGAVTGRKILRDDAQAQS